MAVLLILLYALCITPLRLVFRWDEGRGTAGSRLRVWGVPIRLRKTGRRSAPRGASLRLLRGLGRGVTLRQITLRLRPGGDAAAAALLTGLLRSLSGAFPRFRWETARSGSAALQCILEARLGKLWAAALPEALGVRRKRRKEKAA